MYHVREFLAELPVHMDLSNFYARLEREDKLRETLESASSGTSLTTRARSLIGNFVTNADEEILRKIDDVARKICNKVNYCHQLFSIHNSITLCTTCILIAISRYSSVCQ